MAKEDKAALVQAIQSAETLGADEQVLLAGVKMMSLLEQPAPSSGSANPIETLKNVLTAPIHGMGRAAEGVGRAAGGLFSVS